MNRHIDMHAPAGLQLRNELLDYLAVHALSITETLRGRMSALHCTPCSRVLEY